MGISQKRDTADEPQQNEETVYWAARGKVYHSRLRDSFMFL